MSWNINGIRSTFGEKEAVGKINLASFLASNDCDIYCFQETKASDWSKLTKDLVNVKSFDSFWDFSKKKKGYSGTVTFARKGSTKNARTGFGHSDFDDEGRCVMTDHGDFILFNVYFPNGGMGEERLLYKYKYYDAFHQEISKLIAQDRRVIITGDINTAHKDIDIWNPVLFATMTGFLPKEREWIDRMLKVGFVDAFRKINPDKKKSFTFWDMRTNKRPANNGWRIDYFLVSSCLENQILNSEILADVIESLLIDRYMDLTIVQ